MLNGKIAIVTGGTRGIGLAVVRTFLHNGAKVALFGSRETSVQRALAQLREEQPDWPVMGLWPDLTDYAAVERAVQEVAQTFGGVDILVNNAGISAREPLADYSPEAFRSIMDLNVTAVFHGCKAVEPIMRAAGKGCIINTSSMVSLYGQPGGVGYPASKFAVNGLTRSLARELGRAGIRVNAVAPGVTRTDMVAALPQELIDAINNVGFWDSIPLWAVTLIGGLLITVLSFTMILTVYGRMFSLWMYAAIAPIPLSTFAGEPTSSVGKNFIRSYAGVCLQGVVIALSCIIFSAISSSPPAVDTSTSVVTAVWTYVGELAFNLLVLVGAIKGCDRIVKEIMGL